VVLNVDNLARIIWKEQASCSNQHTDRGLIAGLLPKALVHVHIGHRRSSLPYSFTLFKLLPICSVLFRV